MAALPVPVAPADLQDNGAIGGAPAALREALELAASFAKSDRAGATLRAYAADFDDFRAWCASVDAEPLPAAPAIIAAYLSTLTTRGLKASTIKRRLAAIRSAHLRAGRDNPTAHELVKAAHKGIRRSIGTRVEQKAPATAKVIGSILKRVDLGSLAGVRDRALLLVGFAGALRRSELVALRVEDVRREPGGIIVTIGKSKTDQEGAGQEIAIPSGSKLRPVDALFAWIGAAGITSGPIFRAVDQVGRVGAEALTPQTVRLLVRKYAAAAKLNPDEFAGHSLRAGFVTSALESGADVFAAADQGRWRKLETVREYDRRAKAFSKHAGKGFL